MLDHWQKSKINKSFSSRSALPQGSFLFNVYLNCLYYFLRRVYCFIFIFYVCNKNLDFAINNLDIHSIIATKVSATGI